MSDPAGFNINGDSASPSNGHSQAKPIPHPHLPPSGGSSNHATAAAASSLLIPVPRDHPSPEYDFADEENSPSPSLKRVDKAAALSFISNPSNVLQTSVPNSSSRD